METQTIDYLAGNLKCRGYLAYEPGAAKKPGIVIAHAWMGLDDFARDKAKALAQLGYVALAADLYGHGTLATTKDEAVQLMMPLFTDRKLLQERIKAAYETLKSQPQVDPKRIGAIGFCFGGLTVVELLRSGADVKGVVSFHGALGNSMGEMKAKTVPIASKASGALLILHGHDDPLVSQEDIHNLQKELTQAGVDWQMHIYGHTKHAFTNPQAHDESMGLFYNKKAAHRSWEIMQNFFSSLL